MPKGVPAPSLVIDSGGGWQAFWRLEESLVIDGDPQKAEEAEGYNRALEQAFGADHCFDVSPDFMPHVTSSSRRRWPGIAQAATRRY